jgi:hypothetical protein
MAVTPPAIGGKAGDDHIRTEVPDHPDHIGESGLMAPDLQGLLWRLGVTEVDRAGEVLLGAVETAGGQQLLRADDTEEFPLL